MILVNVLIFLYIIGGLFIYGCMLYALNDEDGKDDSERVREIGFIKSLLVVLAIWPEVVYMAIKNCKNKDK
jgi:hypothetical protein